MTLFHEEDIQESVLKGLRDLNRSIERIGFNGAVVRDFGAIEGLTVAVRETGMQVTDAIVSLKDTMQDIADKMR